MRHRRRRGAAGAKLLAVLLLGLAGAGGWNYRRNLAAEQARPRPYRGYTEQAVEQLAAAYRQEIQELGARSDAARASRRGVQDRALLDQQIGEFERVQRQAERERALGRRLGAQEAALADLEAELQRREAERDGVRLFLRRLLSF